MEQITDKSNSKQDKGYNLLRRAQIKDMLTTDEAAEWLGMSPKSLSNLTAKKEIPHYKPLGKLYFKKEELTRWMQGNRIASNAEIDSEAATRCAVGFGKY